MKLIITALFLAIGTFVFGQCPLPDYSWKHNKNRFEIKEAQFTSAVYIFQWKDQFSDIWISKEVKLHAVSSINCKNGSCTYTVGVVETTLPGSLFYGVHDGWVVRFAKKCSGGELSPFTQEYIINL